MAQNTSDTAIVRQSLTLPLDRRYKTSNEGGAYNAKLAGTSTDFSPQAALYDTTGNFVVKQQKGISNFKGTDSGNYKEISDYAANLSTVKYK